MRRLGLVGAVAAALTALTFAQAPEKQTDRAALARQLAEHRNMDARFGLVVREAVPQAGQQAEVNDLRALLPDLRVEFDASTGVTKSLWNMGGFLTPADARDPKAIAEDFMAARARLLGLSDADVVDVELTDEVYSSLSGVTHLYYRQRVNGIPVFNGQLQFNIAKDGRILSINNAFLPNLTAAIASLRPGLDATAAVASAGEHLGQAGIAAGIVRSADGLRQTTELSAPDLSTEPIKAELMVLPVSKGEARLVWNFQVYTLDAEHAFDMTVDAETGQVWTRFDWVAADQYRVFQRPVESPNHASPVNTRALVVNPAHATASPFGWHDTNGAAGAEFTTTQGNNAHAYTDTNNDGVPDAGSSPDCGVTLNCDFALDLTQEPASYRPAAVANLFYWNNLIHDIQHRYGFDEPSGSFQVNNYGRGGLGNDDVRAEAQDGGGINNANFLTPADGSRPRMQMYLWNLSTPQRDGDFDNGVIVHEYGHGISNRLVGGPSNVSCLGNAQQPGEGISDWLALVYTATASQTATQGRGIGTYVLNQPTTGVGIRALPYSTDPAVNNWTYATISTGVAVPHGVGAVWAQGMWEVYWALVSHYGFNADLYNATGGAGNQRAMLYHNEGLKNSACSPGFTQVRDGIIQAAQTLNGGADVCRLWGAFAGFGLGVDAVNPSPNSNAGIVNGFNVPMSCGGTASPDMTINDVSVTEGNAGTTTATFTVSLAAASASPSSVNYTVVDGTATGATATSSATVVTIPAGAPTTTVGPATPYPSTINVAGAGTIQAIGVRLNGLTHTYPNDIDALLVGPGGQRVMLTSDAGGTTAISGVNLTFRDGYPPVPSPAVTGTYAPTDVTPGETMPAPAPAGPYGTALSVFNGTDPNGTWSLYIADDVSGDVGSLSGWSLLLTTQTTADYVPASGVVSFTAGQTSRTISVTVNGDTQVEPNETFFVNLSNPVNAILVDAQGQGTILNDDGGGGAVPTTVADTFATSVNTPLTVSAPGVLANDNTNGGGAMTASLVSGVTSGTLSLSSNGGFSYTPAAGFTGAATFTYRAVNTVGNGNVVTVTINVSGGVPTSVNDAYSTVYPTALTVTAPGVLGNDNTNGGGAMTAVLVSNVSNGTLTLGSNGSVSYTPNFGFAGTDTFTYRAQNGIGPGTVATVTITVNPPTNVQAPYNLTVDSVAGNLVTLRWNALPIGPQASTFVLEGGLFPGQVLASIATNSPYPIFTLVVPSGSWSIRMHGQLGADKSAASNEVPLHVNVPVTPSAPTNLLGLVSGTTLNLTWKNTFGGGPPASVVLDVTGSATLSLPMGPADSFAFTPVPGGSYTFRVREVNGGGSSPASAPVSLSFPGGCTGAPDMPANFLAHKIGNTVFVLWDPPASGAAPTSFLLDVSGAFVGAIPTTGRALSGVVGPGSYTLRVRAVNACGVSAFTPAQTITVP